MRTRLVWFVLCLTLSAPLHAERIRIDHPTIDGYALDYCRKQARDCGKPAADAYCKQRGYFEALVFTKGENSPPTRTILDKEVCTGPECDRIDVVICLKDEVYRDPYVRGYALDACRDWASNCGKPAADAFCRAHKHKSAVRFEVRKNSPPTRVINGGRVCNTRSCDRIVSVTCRGERPSGPRPTPDGQSRRDDGREGKKDDMGDSGVYPDEDTGDPGEYRDPPEGSATGDPRE